MKVRNLLALLEKKSMSQFVFSFLLVLIKYAHSLEKRGKAQTENSVRKFDYWVHTYFALICPLIELGKTSIWTAMTLYVPVFSFYTPYRHESIRKSLVFWYFESYKNGTLGLGLTRVCQYLLKLYLTEKIAAVLFKLWLNWLFSIPPKQIFK